MKIYMIVITGNPTSEYYKDACLKSWNDKGYEVIHFEATVPETIPENGPLRFGILKGKRSFSDTERAVWYSHYNLWKHCVEIDEPIHVLEHDSYLLDHLPVFDNTEIELFGLFDYRHNGTFKYAKYVVSPCAGYYITPTAAEVMIKKAEKEAISINVDWIVHDTYDDFHLEETGRSMKLFQQNLQGQCVVQQLYIDHIGTTILHPSYK